MPGVKNVNILPVNSNVNIKNYAQKTLRDFTLLNN